MTPRSALLNGTVGVWIVSLCRRARTRSMVVMWFTSTGPKCVFGVHTDLLTPGKFVWAPAPAAAGACVEELRRAQHKCQESTHLFVVPRLMQPLWRKQLYKAADVVLTLLVGHPFWPEAMHEPLILAFCFPYLKHSPWELRQSALLLGLGKCLSEMWRDSQGSERPVLRELWGSQTKISFFF